MPLLLYLLAQIGTSDTSNSLMNFSNQLYIKRYELGFQFIEHMITLSAILIGLTITFTTDVVKSRIGRASTFLKASWVAFLVSILCGLIAMMGVLVEEFEISVDASGLFSTNTTNYALIPTSLQFLFFVAAVILMIISGALSLKTKTKTSRTVAQDVQQ